MQIAEISRKLLLILLCLLSHIILAADISVTVLDKNNKPVEGIVVYISGDNLMNDYQGKEVTIFQQDNKFVPYITVKTPKDMLVFENKDSISHHIFTVLSKELEVRLKKNERLRDHNITTPGDSLLACNIHDWMVGYVFSVDTPFHGKSDVNGRLSFTLPDAGELTATIWHPQLDNADQSQSQTFTITTAQSLTFRLTETMAEIPTQDSEEIFDFLDDY